MFSDSTDKHEGMESVTKSECPLNDHVNESVNQQQDGLVGKTRESGF